MDNQDIHTFFNTVYNSTYRKVLAYIIAKCGNVSDISDIFQETYMEFYAIISKKGIKYIKNSEAILMKLARQKIYRNFSKSSRIKEQLLFLTHANHDDEYDFADLTKDKIWIEDSIVNNELIKEINLFLMQKPEIIKKIFYLYYYLELSIPEIAKALSLGESNVKNKLYRTLKELRKIYL